MITEIAERNKGWQRGLARKILGRRRPAWRGPRFPCLDNALGPRYLKHTYAAVIDLDIAAFPYMGFGATIGWIHAAYLARDALGAELVVRNVAQWPFGGRHSECSLDRFITFPGTRMCAEAPVGALPYQVGCWDSLRRWGYFDQLHWPHCSFGWRPVEFESLDAYRSHVMRRVYQPTVFVDTWMKERLSYLPNRYFAWHIRRGDKTAGKWKEDDPIELSAYMEATRRIVAANPSAPRDIVICTDSDAVLEEAESALSEFADEFRFLYDQHETRWNGYCELHRTGQISQVDDMIEEVLTAQKVLETLRRASYLIGCNSSCLFRVAYYLLGNGASMVSLSENKKFKKYYPV